MAFSILGVAGSLRAGSYNRALLAAAIELAPEGLQIEAFELLGRIPAYDADLEARGEPEAVAAFKAAIRGAEGLLIATPEYNHSIPGVLKNAIDWASRPAASPAFGGKPVAIMGRLRGPAERSARRWRCDSA
jgi:chromate reductase